MRATGLNEVDAPRKHKIYGSVTFFVKAMDMCLSALAMAFALDISLPVW